MKAFHVAVLGGLSRLDVNGRDASLYTLGQIVPTAHLGPVIGTKKLRRTALIDNSLQHSCHAPARHTAVRFQSETFARECIDHAEDAQASPTRGDVAGEINGPFLIRCCQHARRAVASGQSLAPDASHAKPRGTIHPLHSFVVDTLAGSP